MNKDKRIIVRVSENEREKIKDAADKLGLPISTFVRLKILELITE